MRVVLSMVLSPTVGDALTIYRRHIDVKVRADPRAVTGIW
jgi:hypothetical protein